MTNYALPSTPEFPSITFRMASQNFATQSPFTFQQQVINHPGRRWGADVTLPPMRRSSASVWLAWLAKLDGQLNTFNLGPPLGCRPQGEGGGTPEVNGNDQTGSSLLIRSASTSQTDWLKAGDYFQLGAGASARLYMVTEDIDTGLTGGADLPIWPPIVTAPSTGDAVTVQDPVGTFRLASNVSTFSVDQAAVYGIQFGAIGVI